jgi:hypothetical protein
MDSQIPVSSAPLAGTRLRAACLALVVIGASTFVGMLFSDMRQHAWAALLQGMMVPTFIAIGGMFFIAAHSAAGSTWTTPLRRVMEGLTAGIPLTLIAFIAIAAAGGSYLYEWVHLAGDKHAHHGLFHAHNTNGLDKSAWMTPGRWIATTVGIIAIWWLFRTLFVKLSLAQDAGAEIKARHVRLSIAWLMVMAFTFTMFCWDLILALHVNFVSAMWGVYCFTSAVQTFVAVLILVVLWLRQGPMAGAVRSHTLHDLGTWSLVWAAFCAYIAFAQYLVVYYANLDEETFFFLMRMQHGYGHAYVAEFVLRFLVPFTVLMSQSMRARPGALIGVSILVLLGNWMDWSWLIMPAFSQNAYRGFYDLPTLLIGAGFAGAMLLLALAFWRKHGVLPKGDSRLQSTINAEHLH